MESPNDKQPKSKFYARSVTTAVLFLFILVAGDFYSEYVISRPCPEFLVLISTIGMLGLAGAFISNFIKIFFKN